MAKGGGPKNKSQRMDFPYGLKDSASWDIADQPSDLWNNLIWPS